MMEPKNRQIEYSKIVYCPECNRQVARMKPYNGVPLIEFKHKGAWLLGTEMTIRCLGCKRVFMVDAQQGIIDEVNLGTVA